MNKIVCLLTLILIEFSTSFIHAANAADDLPADIAVLRKQYESLAKKTETQVKKYRSLDDANPDKLAAHNALQQFVVQMFQVRQDLQRAEVATARTELADVERRIAERDRLKDVIVRRRVEDLLIGKDAAWVDSDDPDHYPIERIEPGDIVAIYIEGVLPFSSPDRPPGLPPITTLSSGDVITGFPLTVVADGTIQLPLVTPIKIAGLTVREAEQEIARHYVDQDILRPEKARPMITLVRRKSRGD